MLEETSGLADRPLSVLAHCSESSSIPRRVAFVVHPLCNCSTDQPSCHCRPVVTCRPHRGLDRHLVPSWSVRCVSQAGVFMYVCCVMSQRHDCAAMVITQHLLLVTSALDGQRLLEPVSSQCQLLVCRCAARWICRSGTRCCAARSGRVCRPAPRARRPSTSSGCRSATSCTRTPSALRCSTLLLTMSRMASCIMSAHGRQEPCPCKTNRGTTTVAPHHFAFRLREPASHLGQLGSALQGLGHLPSRGRTADCCWP